MKMVDAPDGDVKRLLVERGETFAQTSIEARAQIAQLGAPMIDDGAVAHARPSRIVAALFLAAAKTKHFSAVAESHPDGDGHATAKQPAAAGVPVTMVEDNAVAHLMPRRQMVLCAAEAVVESGGARRHPLPAPSFSRTAHGT